MRTPAVHLNLSVRGLGRSATLAIQQRCTLPHEEGREVFRLGLGQSPFPVPRAVVEELRANAHRKDYLPVEGLPQLREAVAEYFRRREGLPRTGEDVLVGPGSKELMFLLQLVYYGDLVVPSPAWVSYAPQARIAGRLITWIPTRPQDGWRLTAEQLRACCAGDADRPRIVILNYPNNPTGRTYPARELEKLADVARRHRVVVLSDEIYGELHHKDGHVSIARYYPEGTIVSSGLSKWCGAGGWRLGVFVFPPMMRWLRESMAAVASETYTSTSTPIQHAAVRAFQGGIRIQRYLWHARRVLRSLGRFCATRLREAGARVDRPEGAFYLFPDFASHAERLARRGITDSRIPCERLLEDTGVAVLPGAAFGRAQEELTARLAYVDFDGARAIAAAESTPGSKELNEEFLRRYCGGVLKAMDRIGDWLAGSGPKRIRARRPAAGRIRGSRAGASPPPTSSRGSRAAPKPRRPSRR